MEFHIPGSNIVSAEKSVEAFFSSLKLHILCPSDTRWRVIFRHDAGKRRNPLSCFYEERGLFCKVRLAGDEFFAILDVNLTGIGAVYATSADVVKGFVGMLVGNDFVDATAALVIDEVELVGVALAVGFYGELGLVGGIFADGETALQLEGLLTICLYSAFVDFSIFAHDGAISGEAALEVFVVG